MQAYAPSFRPDRRGLMKAAGALAGLSLLPKGTLAAEDKQVNFYHWDTYIGETTLDITSRASSPNPSPIRSVHG
ncbi:MAG: hypothetical protein OXC53_07750, partial [Rhodobacteraceae bacterium]|nr:hypothetical protein [Paracoccaceae bacterium]